MNKQKPDPQKYPIHISRSGMRTIYLCGDKLQYTPPPVKLMDDVEWHNERPICKACANAHFAKYGEVIQWPPKQ